MDGLSLSRAEQDLIADIEYARQYASSTRADRGAWQFFIEQTEERLRAMRAPITQPSHNHHTSPEPTADDEPDTAAPELCGCGRPRSHRGTCRHRIANRNGGGRKRPQQGRRRAIAAQEAAEVAPAAAIAPAAPIAPEITFQFSVLVQRGEDRIEVRGGSPELFRKAVELIGVIKNA